MKILRYVFYFLLLICLSTGVQAAKKIATLYIPAGSMGVLTGFQFNLSILTPEGAQYGVYQSRSVAILNVPLVSWTGQGTAPELHLEDARTILPTSRCPGLEEYDARTPQTTWACVEMKVTVFYDGDMHGCPWIVSSYVKSEDATEAIYTGNNVPYIGPTKVSSDCSAIPLDPYDVSWNENTVVHNKIVRMQSTGAVIEQTLPTYLMEGGKLCDGSKYDERGAYCRFVAQQMTFSTSGCDDAKVTVTPEPQPITSRQLHDMKLRVDTTAQQPIDATCRFTYILNMH